MKDSRFECYLVAVNIATKTSALLKDELAIYVKEKNSG